MSDEWMIDAALLDWCCAPTDDECGICTNEATLVDRDGFPWCEEHRYRYEFLLWGARHGWPALTMEPYAVEEGKFFYCIAATQGSDEMVWMLKAASELFDHEKQAS